MRTSIFPLVSISPAVHLRTARALCTIFAPALLSALLMVGCKPKEHIEATERGKPPVAAPVAPPLVPETFDVASLVERVKPTVVNITTTQEMHLPSSPFGGGDPFDFFFGPRRGMPRPQVVEQTSLGTGFIIDPSGLVVTNNHVVNEATQIRVRLADEREFPAEIKGRDPKLDIALLQVKGAEGLPAAVLGSSDALRVGEYVVAVGNPFGLGHTVTHGIVSAKARMIGAGPYDDFIQTDASINPGNSGGPLFNGRGEVIGVNTAIRQGAQGIGFAIPVDDLKNVLQQLREKGRVDRGFLGVNIQRMTPSLAKALGMDTNAAPQGALVVEVEPGSAADKAGIKPRDVIVSLNGEPVTHAEELPRLVAQNPPGTEVKVTVLRGGERKEMSAKLDAQEASESTGQGPLPGPGRWRSGSEERLGLYVSNAEGGGVRVEQVLEGSEIKELEPGDVIVALDGAPTPTVEAMRAALEGKKPGSVALAKVKRGRGTMYVPLPIPASGKK